jgi:prepilin-type N-terminal cleavage/methylation domain-containing protein
MTSSTATNLRPRRRRAFTLVELLVVVGIIVVLLAILLPMLANVRKKATRTRIAMDLQNLSQALESYRGDFKDYPPVDVSGNSPITATDRLGAVTLCWALLAPGPDVGNGSDGALGPGFRVRGTQGQVYGPYIQPGKFSISGTTDWDSTINDLRGNPYLYYRANASASIHVANGYVAAYNPTGGSLPVPMYNYYDNNGITINNQQFSINAMKTILGDTNNDGGINVTTNTGETPATNAPYLLWSAGPDGILGYDSSGNTDDVTNFNQ